MAHLTEVRWHDKEGDLGMTRAGVWLLPPSPIPVAEPVRVVVLDCSGITFADAAGAREVVQVRDGVGCGESPLSISCIPANADVGFNTPPHLRSWPADAEMLGSTFSWLSVVVRGGHLDTGE